MCSLMLNLCLFVVSFQQNKWINSYIHSPSCMQIVQFLLLCLPMTAIRCKSLPALINGTILGNDVLYGAVIRYQCNVGFRLEGPETRTCQADETWSEHDPTCSGIG